MVEIPADNLIKAMLRPSFYDHPAKEVELIETHISWIFLAGDYAYKVKKPVNFGFLDFSTLAKRRHYCSEELRLNRRFSPEIYLDIKQIGGTQEDLALNQSPALEYAVKMRRFPQEQQLDRMLAAHRLQVRHIVAFAKRIAALHQIAAPAEAETPYGRPESVIAPMLENFRQIAPFASESDETEQLSSLKQWTHATFKNLAPSLRQRKVDGFIRECHGDAHLANMAWVDERPLLFDCIEFNENLRWIDIINDIAFLVMDLDDRGESELGWWFLNHYLQETGDYPGITLLSFYKVYRAMVRAKVTGLRLAQPGLDERERREDRRLYRSYLDLAERYIARHPAPLIITHGLSGSGKTTFTSRLAAVYGGIHIRSDIERKRLHGMAPTAKSGSPIDGGIYSVKAFADTYNRLRALAETILHSGTPAIVDATFIKQQQRQLFRQLAEDLNAPLIILDFPLDQEILRQRIEQRERSTEHDASEATVEVLDSQLKQAEPLTAAEKKRVIQVFHDTRAETVADALRNLTSELSKTD